MRTFAGYRPWRTSHPFGNYSLIGGGTFIFRYNPAGARGDKEFAAWLGGACEALSASIGSGLNGLINSYARKIWTDLKADLSELWAGGREAAYEEAVRKARLFVTEMNEV